MLKREQILEAPDLKVEIVQVPEWHGEVGVRCMCGTDRDAYEISLIGEGGKLNLTDTRAKLLARTLCDEKGEPLFTIADVQALGKKSAGALDRLVDVARRLNGIGQHEIEDLAKN